MGDNVTIPSAHTAFLIAALAYVVAALPSLLPVRLCGAVRVLLVPGILANLLVVWLRYHQAWPMLPMHLGPVLLPLCLALLVCLLVRKFSPMALRAAMFMLALLSLAAVLFPMDFYLPFIRSLTPFSHCFVALGAAGRACFLVSSAHGLASLGETDDRDGNVPLADALEKAFFWGALGYALCTLSLFCGELWSYLGWGTPVVWDDATLLTTMATWFFYTCYLHLHLTRSWSPRGRGCYAACGFLVVFLFTCVPELGPFRSPF